MNGSVNATGGNGSGNSNPVGPARELQNVGGNAIGELDLTNTSSVIVGVNANAGAGGQAFGKGVQGGDSGNSMATGMGNSIGTGAAGGSVNVQASTNAPAGGQVALGSGASENLGNGGDGGNGTATATGSNASNNSVTAQSNVSGGSGGPGQGADSTAATQALEAGRRWAHPPAAETSS